MSCGKELPHEFPACHAFSLNTVMSMKKVKTICLVIIFAAACGIVCGLFSVFSDTTDISSMVIYEESFGFTPDGGEYQEFPKDYVADFELRLDGVYTTTYTVDGGYYSLALNIGAGEAEIEVDGETVYSGSTPAGENILGAGGISFAVLAEDSPKEIVIKARYTDPMNWICPASVLVVTSNELERSIASVVTYSAIFAGISGICFIIAIGLLLMSIYFSSPDWSLLLLAAASISYCLCRLNETGVIEFTGAFAANLLDIARYLIAPEILLFIFLNRKKKILRYILACSAVVAGLIVVANVIMIVFDNVPMIVVKLQSVAKLIYSSPFSNALSAVSNWLLVVCALSVMIYNVRSTAEIAAENSILESRNRAITSAYKNIVVSVRNTAEVRHEWKHDLMTLSLLYVQGRFDEIGRYLDGKSSFINGAERVNFAESAVLDAILNSASARAAQEGVKLSVQVNAPAELGIKDEDLCQLVMNMFDNAFNACSSVSEGERRIDFSAALRNGYLHIRCANSFVPPEGERKKDITSHGFGIITMRKICSRYGSELIIKREDGEFIAMTSLETHKNE